MKPIYAILILFFFPLLSKAQTGEMRVYTVAGSDTATTLGDGGLAIAAKIGGAEGIWTDGKCNLYFTDFSLVRKVNLSTGIITSVVGTTHGFSGDGGPATNAQIIPYGLFVDSAGNILVADAGNNRVRRIDAASGIITTVAGGGTSLGDEGPATDAQLNDPPNVYADKAGNIYIGEEARIRKVTPAGIITTIAGTGVAGYSGDNGPATNAQVYNASTMLTDANDNLIFADRSNSRIRKINMTTGIITTVAGSSSGGYSGDGGPATDAQLDGPISFVIDKYGNIVIGDNGNNVMRKVDASTGIITTIAGDTSSSASSPNGALATSSSMHPEFLFLDLEGNIYYTQWVEGPVRKITNYNPGLNAYKTNCILTGIPEEHASKADLIVYPNPAVDKLSIVNTLYSNYIIKDCIGKVNAQGPLIPGENSINVHLLKPAIYFIEFIGANKTETKKVIKLAN